MVALPVKAGRMNAGRFSEIIRSALLDAAAVGGLRRAFHPGILVLALAERAGVDLDVSATDAWRG